MKVTVPYGRSSLDFFVEDSVHVTRLELNEHPPLEDFDAELERVLNNPTGSAPLRELVQPGETAAVIISDMARASYRTDAYLCRLLDELNRGGIPDESITIVIATGYHAPATPEEELILAGEQALKRVRIVSHSCTADDLAYYGKTRRGNEVYINRVVADADRVVLTGGICYHNFAGFGGGRKSIAPGVAGKTTIEKNHQNCFDTDVPYGYCDFCNSGILENNPVSDEMYEIAAMVGPDFLVNVVVDDDGRFCGVVAGDYIKAHLEGVELIKRIYSIKITEQWDAGIVSCGGAPKDINLWQAIKGVHNASFAVREGGSIVLCAQCYDGPGPDGYLAGFTDFAGSNELWDFLKHQRYDPEMAISFITMRYLRRMKVYLISSLPDEIARLTGMIPVKTPEEAWERIKQDKPGLERIMALPCGSLACPHLEA